MNGPDRCFTTANEDNTTMNHIMLRFRPIAPKPVNNGSGSGHCDLNNKKELLTKKRAKRKYVRVNQNLQNISTSKKKNNKEKDCNDWLPNKTIVTSELLPEIGKTSSEGRTPKNIDYSVVRQLPSLLKSDFQVSDLTAVAPGLGVVESWVTMECVTETFVEEGKLGWTDMEKVNNLEKDTCPGFVSDGMDWVRWVNPAYKRLVDGGGAATEILVWLVAKEKFPVGREAFSCRVRVVYGGGGGGRVVYVPCDVWRMKFGGFAWRLDVEAALSLGR